MSLKKNMNPFSKPIGFDDSVQQSSLAALMGGSISELGAALAGGSGSAQKNKGADDDDDDAWGG